MHTKSVPHFASKLSDQSSNCKYAHFFILGQFQHQVHTNFPSFLPPLPPPMTGRPPRSGCPPPARSALPTLHRAALPAPRGGHLLLHHLHGHHLTSLLHLGGDQLSDRHVVTIILLPLFSAHMSHIVECRPVRPCRRCVRADGRRRTELRTGVRRARTVPPLFTCLHCARAVPPLYVHHCARALSNTVRAQTLQSTLSLPPDQPLQPEPF